VAIGTTSTPEYVSGVVLTVIFASQMVGLQWFSGSAASAAETGPTLQNFALPVLTIAIYGMGYIARMTRASMAEVMTQQYIRTARLKGVSFRGVVLRHALRNALIAPFTVIMLQFPWLLTGVVIVEILFNYRGFGWLLVEAAANNDIDLLLACAIVAVVIVLARSSSRTSATPGSTRASSGERADCGASLPSPPRRALSPMPVEFLSTAEIVVGILLAAAAGPRS
jgi:peptide/nickel transport system permease protein